MGLHWNSLWGLGLVAGTGMLLSNLRNLACITQCKQRPLIECCEADPISCGQYGRSGLKQSACSSSLTHRTS
jgi:hypothetical protein